MAGDSASVRTNQCWSSSVTESDCAVKVHERHGGTYPYILTPGPRNWKVYYGPALGKGTGWALNAF